MTLQSYINTFLKMGYSLSGISALTKFSVDRLRTARSTGNDDDVHIALTNAYSKLKEEKSKDRARDEKMEMETRARRIYRRVLIKSRRYNKFAE